MLDKACSTWRVSWENCCNFPLNECKFAYSAGYVTNIIHMFTSLRNKPSIIGKVKLRIIFNMLRWAY